MTFGWGGGGGGGVSEGSNLYIYAFVTILSKPILCCFSGLLFVLFLKLLVVFEKLKI